MPRHGRSHAGSGFDTRSPVDGTRAVRRILESIAADGVDTFVHIGPGDVTAGLVKRTVKGVDVKVVSSIEQARTVAGELSVQ